MAPLAMQSRLPLLAAAATALLLVLGARSCPAAERTGPPGDGRAFLGKVEADQKSGLLSLDQAVLYQFLYLFEPDELPADYQVAGFSPLKCGTDLVRQYYGVKDRLDPAVSGRIAGYLATAPAGRGVHLSSEGNFQLSYSLTGEDAVPAADVNPADGVPDFVARAAQYLEQSYTVEVGMTGFADPLPADGPLTVSFRSMQSYGYSTIVSSGEGTTALVLHNDFLGFPPNDDPDGDVAGAVKVTCAHEFRHAVQYRTSRWREGGWIELDAVWAEELVFDLTNDYYNYLSGGSPIRHPELPLDGGTTGTGSYEDCVFQLWLQETWGTGLIRDFWQRRAVQTTEPVLDTYDAVLQVRGRSLADAWGEFTAWNYLTGYRARPGLGYGEASSYPYGPVVADLGAYPAQTSGAVEHLAADFIRLQGFSAAEEGTLELDFTGEAGAAPLTVVLVIHRRDGGAVLESLDLSGADGGRHTAAVPLADIESAAVVVGNPDQGGPARAYSLVVWPEIRLPLPELEVVTASVALSVGMGQEAVAVVQIGNTGQEGSVLSYQASLWAADPQPVLLAGTEGRKNIAGSSLTADQSAYVAGGDLDLVLTVHNASTDDEWLTDLRLEFPAGVTLLTAEGFSGGTLGELAWLGPAGDGVTSVWHGEFGSLGYGVIRGGETAAAQVRLAVAPDFSGPLTVLGTLTGDQFGGSPHTVAVGLVLQPFQPLLAVTAPAAGQLASLAQPLRVAWEQDGQLDTVLVALSRDGGQTWTNLVETSAAAGECLLAPGGLASNACLIRLQASGSGVTAFSPGFFTLYPETDWLSCLPAQGEVPVGELASLDLACSARDLAPGSHTAWLVIQHDGPGQPAVVPVQVTVTAAAPGGNPAPVNSLSGGYPNPFNPSAVITFSLERQGRMRLEILDLRGHRVRTLLDEVRPAGRGQTSWDGRDDRGRVLAAGLYLVRMAAGGFTATGKLVLAK